MWYQQLVQDWETFYPAFIPLAIAIWQFWRLWRLLLSEHLSHTIVNQSKKKLSLLGSFTNHTVMYILKHTKPQNAAIIRSAAVFCFIRIQACFIHCICSLLKTYNENLKGHRVHFKNSDIRKNDMYWNKLHITNFTVKSKREDNRDENIKITRIRSRRTCLYRNA